MILKTKPDSSIRTSGRRFRPLFWNAAIVGAPVDDGVVVASAGLASGPLRRVAGRGEPTPQGGRMERDAEFPADQFHDAAGTPEVGANTVIRRLPGQPRMALRQVKNESVE